MGRRRGPGPAGHRNHRGCRRTRRPPRRGPPRPQRRTGGERQRRSRPRLGTATGQPRPPLLAVWASGQPRPDGHRQRRSAAGTASAPGRRHYWPPPGRRQRGSGRGRTRRCRSRRAQSRPTRGSWRRHCGRAADTRQGCRRQRCRHQAPALFKSARPTADRRQARSGGTRQQPSGQQPSDGTRRRRC